MATLWAASMTRRANLPSGPHAAVESFVSSSARHHRRREDPRVADRATLRETRADAIFLASCWRVRDGRSLRVLGADSRRRWRRCKRRRHRQRCHRCQCSFRRDGRSRCPGGSRRDAHRRRTARCTALRLWNVDVQCEPDLRRPLGWRDHRAPVHGHPRCMRWRRDVRLRVRRRADVHLLLDRRSDLHVRLHDLPLIARSHAPRIRDSHRTARGHGTDLMTDGFRRVAVRHAACTRDERRTAPDESPIDLTSSRHRAHIRAASAGRIHCENRFAAIGRDPVAIGESSTTREAAGAARAIRYGVRQRRARRARCAVSRRAE